MPLFAERGAMFGPPHPDEVRRAVQAIVSSRRFEGARRAPALLVYLVDEVLSGRGDAIKEYCIAQDVFQRDDTFDPRLDACVRTEAWRLRRRLREFYDAEGEDEPIRIEFPPRSLAPTFRRNARGNKHAPDQRLAIVIEVVRDEMLGEAGDRFATRLDEELAHALRRLPGVAVHLSESGIAPALRLSCRVRHDDAGLRVLGMLFDVSSGKLRDTESFLLPSHAVAGSLARVVEAVRSLVCDSIAGRRAELSVNLLDEADRMRYLDALIRGSSADRARRTNELKCAIRRHERNVSQDPGDEWEHRQLIAGLGLFLSTAPTAAPAVMPKLRRAAEAVFALNPDLSDVWLTLGLASGYVYDWGEAERAQLRAIAIDPLDPSPYVLLSLTRLQSGNIGGAIEAAEAGLPLDPHSPILASSYGLALSGARRFSEAAAVARRALEVDPDFARLHLLLGDCLMHSGDLDGAIVELETAHASLPDEPIAYGLLGYAHALSGSGARAQALLTDLVRQPMTRADAPLASAIIHLGLGAREEALTALEQAVRRRGTPGLFFASASFDSVRCNDRFSMLAYQMGVTV